MNPYPVNSNITVGQMPDDAIDAFFDAVIQAEASDTKALRQVSLEMVKALEPVECEPENPCPLC